MNILFSKKFRITKASIVTFILIILVTAQLSSYNSKIINEKKRIIFQKDADEIPVLIKKRMKAYNQILLSGTALFYSSKNVTRQEWETFVKELKINDVYPGIQGLGFSLIIKPEDLNQHINNLKAEGFLNYQVKPSGKRDLYTSIIYLEPFDSRNQRAFGYDMYSEKVRQEAMNKAIETGKYTISGKVHLLQENGLDVQAGFLAYTPVYKNNMPLNSFEEKLEATYGFVYAPFRTKDFLNSIDINNNFLDVQIYSSKPFNNDTLLYDSITNHEVIDKTLSKHYELSIGGQVWYINVKPSQLFLEKYKTNENILIIVLGLISAFFAFLLINVYQHYQNRKDSYYKRIKNLSIKKNLALKSATIGIWTWKFKNNDISCDDVMCEIYEIDKFNKNLLINWKAFVEKRNRFSLLKSILKSKKYNIEHNICFWIKTGSGHKKYIHSIGVVDFDKKNRPIGMVGINIDITEYERKKRKFDNYVKLIDKNVITTTTDLKGTITYVSEAYCKISGYSKDELLGKNHNFIKKFSRNSKIYREIWKTISSNKVWVGEIENIRKDGSIYWLKTKISPIFEDGEKVGYTAIREDITDKKIIEKISITDGLTDIYNRRHFNEVFPNYIRSAKRANEQICFIMIDIDFFKQYNDTYGHQKGDEVLICVAKIMKEFLHRADDYCFRLGGEEFGILIKSKSKENSINFANRFRRRVESEKIPHKLNSVSKYVTVSIGVNHIFAKNIQNPDIFYKQSDDLLYEAKEFGRNQIRHN